MMHCIAKSLYMTAASPIVGMIVLVYMPREKSCDYDHVGSDPPNELGFLSQQERRK